MLLELAVGDAYGAGFEYTPKKFVKEHNDLSGYVQHPRHGIRPGCYTDDTQMSLAIAEVIVKGLPWTCKSLAGRLVEVYQRDPREGYSAGFRSLLAEAKNGKDLLRQIRPQSEKSGAAMRALPLGVFSTIEDVIAKGTLQASITHNTPGGIAAANAAALAAHYFLYDLGPKAELGVFLRRHVPGNWNELWRGFVGHRGSESVTAAVTAIRKCDRISELLTTCISYGGDVDTVASIALGAASCSREYEQDLPPKLLDDLEDSTYGRSYIANLDTRLLSMASHAVR